MGRESDEASRRRLWGQHACGHRAPLLPGFPPAGQPPTRSLSVWASPPHCLLSSPADTLCVELNVALPVGWVVKGTLSHRAVHPDAHRPFCALGRVRESSGRSACSLRCWRGSSPGVPCSSLLPELTGSWRMQRGAHGNLHPEARTGSRPSAGSSRGCFREWPRVHLVGLTLWASYRELSAQQREKRLLPHRVGL